MQVGSGGEFTGLSQHRPGLQGRAKELGLKTQQKIEFDREALKAAAK